MSKIKKAIFILFIFVCIVFKIADASSIVLTAVNDEFLPLESGSMPTKKSGEWYVPYGVFNSFGISSYTQDNGDSLVMQTYDQTITFSLSQGYTYDKDFNTLAQPAYYINNNIYLPVKLMCGQFKLSFSVISSENPIVRIYDHNAKLSDSDFLSDKNANTDEIVDDFKDEAVDKKPIKNQEPQPPVETNEPEPVPTQQPVVQQTSRPENVYIAFIGKVNDYSNALIDTLNAYNVKATFFAPIDSELDYNFIRRVVGSGNSIGLYIKGDETRQILDEINRKLFDEIGVMTRIVMSQNGINYELQDAGYIFWDSNIKAYGIRQRASKIAVDILDLLSTLSSDCFIEFHYEKSTNAVLTLILRDLQANNVNIKKITTAERIK